MADQSHKKDIPQMPHVGQLFLKQMRKIHYPQVWIAKYMGKSESVVTRYRHRPSLQCYLLWELSYILKHNFFKDLGAYLPEEFATNVADSTLPLQERIAALEEENNKLKIQVETLKSVIVK